MRRSVGMPRAAHAMHARLWGLLALLLQQTRAADFWYQHDFGQAVGQTGPKSASLVVISY